MAIPISYNVRNLRLRKGLTVMTSLGIALTVTTAIFLMALVAGLDRAFVSSGSPKNVLVLRKGSEAELSGGFDASLFPTLRTLPGIAKDSHGEPMVCPQRRHTPTNRASERPTCGARWLALPDTPHSKG